MATLYFSIRKGKQTVKKTYKIYLAVCHQRKVCYIATDYEVDDIYQFDNGQVVCRKDAKIMNQRLAYVLSEYQEKLDEIPSVNIYSCCQLKEMLEGKRPQESNTSLIKCMEVRIENLKKEGRIGYAGMNEYTLEKIKSILGDISLKSISTATVEKFIKGMSNLSNATKQMRLTHFKACLNEAIREGLVKYDVHPFAYTKMPKSPARQLDLTIEEFVRIRNLHTRYKKLSLARDIFLLSFYLGGINLADLVEADFSGDQLRYVRRKTSNKKQGEKNIVFSIPEEVRPIIKKYVQRNGKLDFGYKFSYHNFQRYLNHCIKELGEEVNIKSNITYYSARKTFSQFAFDLGIRTEIIEYCLGQSMKENRPIYNYVRIMQRQADAAIRRVIDYTKEPDKFEIDISKMYMG